MRPADLQTPGLIDWRTSRHTGVNIETIRYYERITMLPPPHRTPSGRRCYGLAEARTLAFIRRARELGFTLNEIRALLTLSAENGQNACAEVRELAAGHLADIRAKIADLRAMARVLADAVRSCDAGETPGCPLIVLGGLADVERDLIRTRTAEGRSRAQKRGQHMGRPSKLTDAQQDEASRRRAEGATLAELARSYGVGKSTISRLKLRFPGRRG